MSEETNDISTYKREEHINYITFEEGIYRGVSFRYNGGEVVTENGKNLIKFDYDVKGLEHGLEEAFDQYLGEYLLRLIEEEKFLDLKSETYGEI